MIRTNAITACAWETATSVTARIRKRRKKKMVIKIAAGILIGFVFLALLFLLICCISALFVRAQEDRKKERPVHHRIRPERDRYEEMQRLKTRAKEEHPEHWKEDDRW